MQQAFEYTGKDTLEYLKEAVNYNRFLEQLLLKFIAPGREAIDFGAGNGEFAGRLRAHGITVTAIEADAGLRAALAKERLAVFADIALASPCARIYSLNVLEHIEDDAAMLRKLHDGLHANGKLLLYVPAFPCLYTDFDRAIGHFRRYRKKELVEKLQQNGFNVERAAYVDALGFMCWWLMGKLPKNKTTISPMAVTMFDRLVFPLSRIADKMTHPYFGKNLLVIARKI